MRRLFEWFDWRDLIIPVGPGIGALILYFWVWHPLLLMVALVLFVIEAIIISWRIEGGE